MRSAAHSISPESECTLRIRLRETVARFGSESGSAEYSLVPFAELYVRPVTPGGGLANRRAREIRITPWYIVLCILYTMDPPTPDARRTSAVLPGTCAHL